MFSSSTARIATGIQDLERATQTSNISQEAPEPKPIEHGLDPMALASDRMKALFSRNVPSMSADRAEWDSHHVNFVLVE